MVRSHDQPDVVLVAGAQRGESESLNILLERHYSKIYAVCRRVAGNDADAADATQHALLSIARGIARFDGTSAFTTWAYRVATNAALDELRKVKRRPQPTDFADEQAVASLPIANRTANAIEQAGIRIDIDRGLAQLAPEFRAAIVLRELCGLDYQEIADTLGVPVGTVRSRIARGRAALATQLMDHDPSRGHSQSEHSSLSGNQFDPSRRQTVHDV
jgi:RNA polymerase sigma-70 factor, ECF subfamily